jgi:hypothetical protein
MVRGVEDDYPNRRRETGKRAPAFTGICTLKGTGIPESPINNLRVIRAIQFLFDLHCKEIWFLLRDVSSLGWGRPTARAVVASKCANRKIPSTLIKTRPKS